ncbi:LytR/AlgR family response regulator transcription factor [Clostridium baratii]|uniref:LytR/AlgR family response regulator transcription factor n=2 Tax=Clostridium baratii TaxID=1561 RepID=UPI00374E637C
MRVLVIEDEKVQRDNLVKIVERSYINTKAYSAANIKEAKEIVTSRDIDLFFIDINLPDGSGLELAKSIRNIEKYEHTGIVFITTQVIQIIDAFKSTHCYDFLIKPFNNNDIKAIINTFYRKLGSNNIDKGNYLIVPIENGVSVKVYEDEIIFVEYASRKSIIHTAKNVFICKSITLTKLLNNCVNGNIIQSHKSYLINIKYVDKIEKVYSKLYNIYFTNTKEIAQLSNSYKDLVYKKWCNE